VLTSLGLQLLPGSAPGGSEFSSALQQLLQALQSSSLQLLGSGTFRVEEAVAGAMQEAHSVLQICRETEVAAREESQNNTAAARR
jgi:hypothetical protein